LNHIDKNVRREIKEKHPRNDVDVELQKAEAK
ncbi:integrase, partial [Clostridioides difficile]